MKQNGEGTKATGHFVIAGEFWVYVLITVIITVITFAIVFLLQRRWKLLSRHLVVEQA